MARRTNQTDITVTCQIQWRDGIAEYVALTPGFSLYDSHYVEPIDDDRKFYACISLNHAGCQLDNPKWVFQDEMSI